MNLGPVSSPVAGAGGAGGQGGQGGYQQNVYAQELSSAQRASLEEQRRKESLGGSFGFGSHDPSPGGGNNSAGGGGGMLGGAGGMFGGGGSGSTGGAGGLGGATGDGGTADEGMWGAVKGWASGMGNKLAETEEEVWRRTNGHGR